MALPTFRAYVVHQGGLINLKQNGSAGLALWAEIWFTSRLEERDAGEYWKSSAYKEKAVYAVCVGDGVVLEYPKQAKLNAIVYAFACEFYTFYAN